LIKRLGIFASAGAFALSTAAPALAHHPLPTGYYKLDPFGNHVRIMRQPTYAERMAAKTYWTPVSAKAPFGSNGAGTAVLMTDGTVLIHDSNVHWYRLTPDNTGSYINGTWSDAASLPSNYGPLYYADAVLPDGRLVVMGGEYNFGNQVETNLGAIYDNVANTWTAFNAPPKWTEVGDAQSAILPDGTMMMGNCCYKGQALLDASSLTWTITGTGKADANSEEGWALMPNGNLLTVDVLNSNPRQSEIYNPSTGAWTSGGSTGVELVDSALETGPEVLRPDGTVFAAGATGATGIYDTKKGTWKAGPSFPIINNQQYDIADGPASLLLDGKVLMVASPGAYQTPSAFFIFTGKKLMQIPGTPNAHSDSSYDFRMLPLPNGQVLVTDGSNDVEIFTDPGKSKPSWAPIVTYAPTSLAQGSTYTVSGVYFNGLSQAGAYGDDAQAATNYPLVRIVNSTTGHVFYMRSHDFSAMPVASPETVSANFDVPYGIETGAATMYVVANGVPSAGISVNVQ
jgi:hypothetical protein